MLQWLIWLGRLARNPKFIAWITKELGPGALGLFGAWRTRLAHRQAAIDEADQIDGRFSAAIIDGKRHLIVWKDGEPVSAYPSLANGDLREKLRQHNREGLKHPYDLPTRRAARWFTTHVPHVGHHDGDPHNGQPSDGLVRDRIDGERRFHSAVTRMSPLLNDVQQAAQHRVSDHPSIPAGPGIYLFSYDDKPIYVGQSRNLRKRLRQQTAITSRENQASFAFNLAKRSAREAGLTLAGSRAAVEADPEFAQHFEQARREVAQMTVQFIELADPIERTLFEIYASLALETEEFNSFETH